MFFKIPKKHSSILDTSKRQEGWKISPLQKVKTHSIVDLMKNLFRKESFLMCTISFMHDQTFNNLTTHKKVFWNTWKIILWEFIAFDHIKQNVEKIYTEDEVLHSYYTQKNIYKKGFISILLRHIKKESFSVFKRKSSDGQLKKYFWKNKICKNSQKYQKQLKTADISEKYLKNKNNLENCPPLAKIFLQNHHKFKIASKNDDGEFKAILFVKGNSSWLIFLLKQRHQSINPKKGALNFKLFFTF
jgi:hypothetical protein